MDEKLHTLPFGKVKLLPGLFQQRFQLNRKYMLSLKTENLLQNYYLEAGLWSRGTISGGLRTGAGNRPPASCAGISWVTGSRPRPISPPTPATRRSRARRTMIVSELARCQQENGGEWAGSIPEKYLDWVGARQAGLGAALHAPQDPDGSVGYVRCRRQPAGAGDPGALGALVLPLDRASSPASRWTTSSTSRPAECWKCGPTCTA